MVHPKGDRVGAAVRPEALPWEHGAAGQAEKVTQLQVLNRAVLEWHTRRTTRDTASDL